MLLESKDMRRMRIIRVIAHTQNCEKSKTALKAIIRLITGHSTFSGRGVILIELALLRCVLLIVVGGPVLLVLLHGGLA